MDNSNQLKTNKLIAGLISVIVILVLLIAVGVFILNSNKRPENTTPQEFVDDLSTYTDRGTMNPWPHEEPTEGSLQLPTKEELLSIYLKIRQSYETRDYNLYKAFASSERIWHLEHSKDLETGIYNGLPVFSLMGIEGAENFREYGLYICALLSPNIDQIGNTEVVLETNQYSTRPLYLINKKTREISLIDGQNWKYRINLNVELTDNGYQSGSGTIYFVYDDGKWKYHFEDWKDTSFALGGTVGDERKEGDNLFSIVYDQGAFTPEVVNVNVGSIVAWPEWKGNIFSIGNSPEHFNSLFLNEAIYQKRFNQAGKYEYVIYNDYPTKIFTGVINVK